MSRGDWRVAYIRGRDADERKDYANAITAYTEALKLPGADRTRIFASRAFSYFDSFRHLEAFMDASSALAINPKNVRALNARMVVLKESGDLQRVLIDLDVMVSTLAAQGTPDPEFAAQKDIILAKLQSLENFSPVREWPIILFDPTPFSEAQISQLPNWIFRHFQGIYFKSENVKAAAEVLLARECECDRTSPVRYLDDIPKLHVVGNLLGDLSALYKIFEENGYPTADNPYLFNGNLTGELPSVTLVVILVLAKAIDDHAIYFNQGPNDTAKFLRINGFEAQAVGEFGNEVTALLVRILTEAPIITIVNRKFCVLHGGLPEGVALEQVSSGSFWGEISNNPGVRRDPGTVYYTFGPDVSAAFLSAHNLSCIVRSGQPLDGGVSYGHDSRVLTVTSRFRNSTGGVATITGTDISARILPLAPVVKSEVHHGGPHKHLNGLFARLRREFGRNPADIGVIRVITVPDADRDFCPVTTLLGKDITFGFMSLPIPEVGVAVIAPGLCITVEAYTIESAALQPGNDHMKTWQFLGSDDGENWTLVDERKDTIELNGPLHWHTYTVAEPRPYRAYLLKQNEPNHRGNWNICLNRLEFFGKITS